MRPHKEGDHWLIVRKFRAVSGGGITGGRGQSQRDRPIYDCWTGDRWGSQLLSAKTFPTRGAALQYIDANRERLTVRA
jgi:hypothetical protein